MTKQAIGKHTGDFVAIPLDAAFEELREVGERQLDEAQAFFIDFMKKIARLRGVRIDRDHFLISELRKKGVSKDDARFAATTTPATAGIDKRVIDAIARESIDFETKKSTAFSFAAGLPGGSAMAASIPADIAQYYVHAFRIMQKLSYLYGWQSFLDGCDDVDDETLFEMAVLLGVMMGVSSANSALTMVAKNAQEAIAKRVARQPLMKTAWYPVAKKLAGFIGIKITKQTAGNIAGKIAMGIGGVISGALTFVGLSSGSLRLSRQLRQLPQAVEPMPVEVWSEDVTKITCLGPTEDDSAEEDS